MSYVIATDTSANLPTREAVRRNILVVPFSYFIDGHEFSCTDTEAFDARSFYHAMREKTEVSTSLINIHRYLEYFEPVLAAGQDLLYIGMSSGISGAYAAAAAAAEQLREKYPQRRIFTVDTLSASLGEGLQVLHAADCRDEGMELEPLAESLMRERSRMCQIFTVDDLMFLRRTGRVSTVKAVVGTVLNIKPLLKGDENGKILVHGNARGQQRALRALAEEYRTSVVDPEKQIVGIAHADCLVSAVQLQRLICEEKPPKDVMIVDYEPVTGSHVGPGALALFFMGEEGFRSRK